MPEKFRWILTFAVLIWPAVCPAAEAPHELAGFVLGGRIEAHMQDVEPETELPVRYLESLKEVEAKNIRGYKSGLISYTTCTSPARIVRLKFKYADSSKAFYDALLKRLKLRFGDPDEYRGDPFHIVVAWKWSFRDENNNDISLVLQHNTRDEEEKKGNSIKMTMWNLLKSEIQCFEEKQPEESTSPGGADVGLDSSAPLDWKYLVPR